MLEKLKFSHDLSIINSVLIPNQRLESNLEQKQSKLVKIGLKIKFGTLQANKNLEHLHQLIIEGLSVQL